MKKLGAEWLISAPQQRLFRSWLAKIHRLKSMLLAFRCPGLLVGLRYYAQIRLNGFPAPRELFFGRFIVQRRDYDHIVAVFPINRRGHTVVCSQLNGIDDSQNFIKVPSLG